MSTLVDLPYDCLKEICNKDSKSCYITLWFLSQSNKQLRILKPKGLNAEKFIKKLLRSQCLNLLDYYINTSVTTKNFWNYFCNQDYILSYIGNNSDWQFIQLLAPKLSPQQNSIVMEFAILKMSLYELKSYKAISCGNKELDGYRVISMYHRIVVLKCQKQWPIIINNSLKISWCCRHTLTPGWMRSARNYFPSELTINEISHYFSFKHNNLQYFLQQLVKLYPAMDLKVVFNM